MSLGVVLSASGCTDARVDVRAVWVEASGAPRERRIHIYDRGALDLTVVAGETAPQEFLSLGPRGRGMLVRVGTHAGAWYSLEDGRRLVLALPELELGPQVLEFSERGDALWWLTGGGLELVPFAPGLNLDRDAQGVVAPLERAGAFAWVVSSPEAPVLLARHEDGRASFFRYPTQAWEQASLRLEAQVAALPLPSLVLRQQSCAAVLDCAVSVSLSADGELAFAHGADGSFYELDARAPAQAGLLALPPELAEPAALGKLSLLQVLDRSVSVWSGAGQLLRWDRARDQVDVVPVFVAPPLRWEAVDGGRAVVLLSAEGPLMRLDSEGVELISLETSTCVLPASFEPVIAPKGEFAAWTCTEPASELGGASGAIVRVSAAGLERYVGATMRAVAIDDEGGLLLYSVNVGDAGDTDEFGPHTRPRNLFVLSSTGVLTRVDELEPAPVPVLTGSSADRSYFQGVGL